MAIEPTILVFANIYSNRTFQVFLNRRRNMSLPQARSAVLPKGTDYKLNSYYFQYKSTILLLNTII